MRSERVRLTVIRSILVHLAGSAAFAVSFRGLTFFPLFSTTATGRSSAIGSCSADFEEGYVTLTC